MKKIITTLALTAGLALIGAPAMASGTSCTTTTTELQFLVSAAVPAVPAVPGTDAIAPVYETVTEYEFVHKNENHPDSPRWEREGWNADTNANSVGWVATGNTREVATDVVLVPGVDAVPEIPAVPEVPAVYRTEYVDTTVCTEDPIFTIPHGEPTPITIPAAPAEVPAAVAEVPAAPVTELTVDPATEVAPVEAPAEQLAYTGAADWVFPAGALTLLAGAGLVLGARRRA